LNQKSKLNILRRRIFQPIITLSGHPKPQINANLCKYKAACAHQPQNARKTREPGGGAGFDAFDKNTGVFKSAKIFAIYG